jgi:hypothetical protein
MWLLSFIDNVTGELHVLYVFTKRVFNYRVYQFKYPNSTLINVSYVAKN